MAFWSYMHTAGVAWRCCLLICIHAAANQWRWREWITVNIARRDFDVTSEKLPRFREFLPRFCYGPNNEHISLTCWVRRGQGWAWRTRRQWQPARSIASWKPARQRRPPIIIKCKGSRYSITERRVPERIPVLGSQPVCDASHKPGGRLPLHSARPAVTVATLKRAATNFAAWWTDRHSGCEQFA